MNKISEIFQKSLLALLLVFVSPGVTAQSTSDELELLYKNSLDSSEHYLKTDPSRAQRFITRAMEAARKLKDEKKLSRAYLQIGILYRLSGNLNRSEFYLSKALTLGKKFEFYPRILKETGITLKQQSKYNAALDCYLKALNVYQSKNQMAEIAIINNNIGRLYFAMGDDAKALEYYRKSVAIHQKVSPESSSGVDYHNIGAVMEKMNRRDSAEYYYIKALKLYKRSNDRILIAYGYASLGNVLKNKDSSEYYLIKSYELRKELKLETDILESIFYLGKFKMKYQMFSEAEKLFSEAYDLSVRKNNHQYAFESASLLAETYRLRGDFAQAYFYKKTAATWKDSLYQQEKKVKELGFDYRLRQIRQIEKLHQLNNINENQQLQILVSGIRLEKERQMRLFWILIVFFIFLLLIIFAVFFFKQKRKNAYLEQQKSIIEEKSRENEILIREVHHRVKNNLHSVMSLLRLEKRKLGDDSTDKLVENMEKRIMNISFVHEILYNQKNLASVNLKDYLTVIGSKIISLYSEKDISLEVSGTFLVDADRALYVGQLLSELYTNSCKHAFKDVEMPLIKVYLRSLDQHKCSITYSDNGLGFMAETKKESFGKKLIESHGRKLQAVINEFSSDGYTCNIEFNRI